MADWESRTRSKIAEIRRSNNMEKIDEIRAKIDAALERGSLTIRLDSQLQPQVLTFARSFSIVLALKEFNSGYIYNFDIAPQPQVYDDR